MAEKSDSYSSKLRKFHGLSFDLISLADKGTLVSSYFKDISSKILQFSHASRMNITVNDISNYYRFSFSADNEWSVLPVPDFTDFSTLELKDNSETTLEELEKILFSGIITPPAIRISNALEPFQISNISMKISSEYLSFLILPVRIDREVIGLISLEWENAVSLSDEDIELYQYVFDIVGFARSHRQAKFQLGERIKELTTIYQITRLGARIDKSLDDVLSGAADIIPPGFLHPDLACCKIVYANKIFESKNFKDPEYILREDITAGGENMGYVEVGYTGLQNNLDKGPFLKEEQPMLMTIAGELGLIAERKHFEDERERLQQQLLHADRLVTVGQLTAGVAHELNEPLGGILGFAQLIKKYGEINENVEKDIDKIIKASLHAREIIRKLMLFSRQTPPEKTLFDINERINDGIYLLESRLKKSSITLKKELSENLPMVKVDPSQLNQVLVNLVVNAIQAMPDGGTLTIQTEASINAINMTIKDTGTGMTGEQIDKIFIPFYTTKGLNEGTGLGLPVVLGIVQSHGGSINVQSEPGKGSAFIVRFPINGEKNGS